MGSLEDLPLRRPPPPRRHRAAVVAANDPVADVDAAAAAGPLRDPSPHAVTACKEYRAYRTNVRRPPSVVAVAAASAAVDGHRTRSHVDGRRSTIIIIIMRAVAHASRNTILINPKIPTFFFSFSLRVPAGVLFCFFSFLLFFFLLFIPLFSSPLPPLFLLLVARPTSAARARSLTGHVPATSRTGGIYVTRTHARARARPTEPTSSRGAGRERARRFRITLWSSRRTPPRGQWE